MADTETEVVLPSLGDRLGIAKVGHWLKKPGDVISVGEPLVEIETDKATMEITAAKAGILKAILAEEGTLVEVGAALATLTVDNLLGEPPVMDIIEPEPGHGGGTKFVDADLTGEDWEWIKTEALRQFAAATLDSPEHHLAYVRERISYAQPL